MIKALINKLLHKHNWYRLDELVVGGNCGARGSWMLDIFPVWWRWGLCEKCIKESEE